MTKNTKIYFVAMLCIVVLCLVLGIATRNSYVGYSSFAQMEEEENLQGYPVQISDAGEYDEFAAPIDHYSSLEEASDLIAKVSATNERKMFPYTVTKTKVIVEEVWKGDAEIGQPVFIYEPANFSYSVSKTYQSTGGYQIMEEGKEYYVFLQKLKTAEGYKMSDQEKDTYLPSTASYSKYPVQEGDVEVLNKKRLNNGGYSYGEIQNEEIITSDQKILLRYNKIKEEVLKADLYSRAY